MKKNNEIKLTIEQFQKELMFTRDVADYCGFSTTRVGQLEAEGRLKIFQSGKEGKKWTLRRFVEPHKTPTSIRNKRRGMR